LGEWPDRRWDGGGIMRKTRWKARIAGGLIALTGLGLAGCRHQLFLEPADWKEAVRPNIPPTLESQPYDPIVPPGIQPGVKPATILDPRRSTRSLSLKEALAIAIEQGNTGAGINGTDNQALPNFQGRGTSGTDTIKAFVLDPAVAQAEVERSLSKFDARWISSMTWAKQDQATLSLQQSFSNGDSASLTSTLAKPLPTGGMAGITTSINYLNLASAPTNSQFIALTTSYTPRVQFIFEQPLLQGFGVEANQLLGSHPGSLLIPGLRPSGGQGSEGILVTRVRTEQARYQFDSQINQMLYNVEQAYWNLYAAYYNKYAQEVVLEQAFALFVLLNDRVKGGINIPSQRDLVAAQYLLFRTQLLNARQQVLDSDRILRGLLGLKSNDGTVFVPADAPLKVLFSPDVDAVFKDALQSRPELMIARQEVKARQFDLLNQKQLRRPDARLFTSYDINALGGGLGESLGNLGDNKFNSWQVGLRLDMPLGFRDANALTRQSQLSLWKAYEQLRDSERKVFEGVVEAVRQMELGYETYNINEKRSKALTEAVDKLTNRAGNIPGEDRINQLNALIVSQRDLAQSISEQYRGLAAYNSAIARLEYVKGTIQTYNNISVADGPLPAFVQKKAADHFRARDAALKLREHPADTTGPAPAGNFEPMPTLPPPPGGPQPAPALPPSGGMTKSGGSNLPDLLPPPLAAPKPLPLASQPATNTPKSWDVWQSPPIGTAPASPPTPLKPASAPLEGTGTFKPDGSVTLPTRPVPATPIMPPALPLSGPTTPILDITPR